MNISREFERILFLARQDIITIFSILIANTTPKASRKIVKKLRRTFLSKLKKRALAANFTNDSIITRNQLEEYLGVSECANELCSNNDNFKVIYDMLVDYIVRLFNGEKQVGYDTISKNFMLYPHADYVLRNYTSDVIRILKLNKPLFFEIVGDNQDEKCSQEIIDMERRAIYNAYLYNDSMALQNAYAQSLLCRSMITVKAYVVNIPQKNKVTNFKIGDKRYVYKSEKNETSVEFFEDQHVSGEYVFTFTTL